MPARLNDVLAAQDIVSPTPIQLATLPDSLAGRDILGRGRTGSGKTLAFVLPLVARLSGEPKARPGTPRALIIAPTRELVAQIDAVLAPLAAAAGLTSRTVFGGVGQNPQVSAIRGGVDIIVACPGRLEDLIQQGHCSLGKVTITILDEADHLADLGFLPIVKRLLDRTPAGGQRMLFSATLDKAVDAVVRKYLNKPAVHEADSALAAADAPMAHHVLHVEREGRLPVLVDLTSAPGRTVVFTRTKHGAKALTKSLINNGVPAVELHGNLSQNARTRNLDDFHAGRVTTLVATDIAARGIHVDDVSLVIHADPPADHKAYLHRSGRTARAGKAGTVITFMTGDQKREVADLTRAAGIHPTITRLASADHPILVELAPGVRTKSERPPVVEVPAPVRGPKQARNGGGGGRGAGAPGRPRRGGGGRSSGSGRASGDNTSTAQPTAKAKPANRPARKPAAAAALGSVRVHSASSFSSGRR